MHQWKYSNSIEIFWLRSGKTGLTLCVLISTSLALFPAIGFQFGDIPIRASTYANNGGRLSGNVGHGKWKQMHGSQPLKRRQLLFFKIYELGGLPLFPRLAWCRYWGYEWRCNQEWRKNCNFFDDSLRDAPLYQNCSFL